MSNVEFNRSPHILKETTRGVECFRVEDEFFDKREIFLTTEIQADSASELIKQLMYLDRKDRECEITLYINSPGGNVNSGLAVYDCIRLIQAPVKTICMGIAASMGSIIFLAGDKREMFPHTQIMIHDPYYGGDVSGMKPLELKERFDNLMQNRSVICEIIAKRTGRSLEEVYEKTKTDSYFTAKEAIDFGLATAVTGSI